MYQTIFLGTFSFFFQGAFAEAEPAKDANLFFL